METVWLGLVNVFIADGLCDGFSGDTHAFVNVLTLADSLAEYQRKVIECFDGYGWKILEISNVRPAIRKALDGELADLAVQVETNPRFVLYGTFHSYPFEGTSSETKKGGYLN
jgi:hypothetical protein